MATRDDDPSSPARPASTPWWRRALGALGFGDAAAGVGFSDDAALAVSAIDAGQPFVDALVQSAELAAFFSASGIDPETVHADVDPRWHHRLLRGAKVSARSAGRDVVTTGDILHLLLILPNNALGLPATLAKHGITKARLTTFMAHRVLEHPRITPSSAPRAEQLDVLLHNDDYTPQDVVTDVLKRVFGLDHKTAVEKMLEVHHRGATVVVTLDRAPAIAAANSALDEMRARGFPLLVTVESFA